MNTIMADYANINEQIKFLRSDMPPESFLSTQNLLAKSALVKNRSASTVAYYCRAEVENG